MLKKIGLMLTTFFVAQLAYSIPNHSLMQGITLEYKLPSYEPQLFSNYLFWSVEARCILASQDEHIDLLIKAIKKKGKVNDVVLVEGQSIFINGYTGQELKINAESGARVEVTNYGQSMVIATCSS